MNYLRWWIWIVYCILTAVAVPWYWPQNSKMIFWGMPLWVFVTISAALLISLFSAWLLSHRWPNEIEDNSNDE